jgi:hypothetical protein
MVCAPFEVLGRQLWDRRLRFRWHSRLDTSRDRGLRRVGDIAGKSCGDALVILTGNVDADGFRRPEIW